MVRWREKTINARVVEVRVGRIRYDEASRFWRAIGGNSNKTLNWSTHKWRSYRRVLAHVEEDKLITCLVWGTPTIWVWIPTQLRSCSPITPSETKRAGTRRLSLSMSTLREGVYFRPVSITRCSGSAKSTLASLSSVVLNIYMGPKYSIPGLILYWTMLQRPVEILPQCCTFCSLSVDIYDKLCKRCPYFRVFG